MRMSVAAKLLAPCAAVLTALLLAACGSSGKGLIQESKAGPLRRDFEAVARLAAKGNGNCAPTSKAIARMKRHFSNLPGSVDVALREKLEEGIENLSANALALCEQPKASTTTTNTVETVTTPSTNSTSTTSTETETEATETEETAAIETESLPTGKEDTEGKDTEGKGGEQESGGTGVEAPTPPPEEQPSEHSRTGGASAP